MKILFLTHKFYPEIGGIEVNSEILTKGFVNQGHQLRVLTWTVYHGENFFPFEIIRRPSIIQIFKSHLWADVVFENNPCLQLGWPSYFLNKPSIVAIRTWINRIDGTIAWQDKLKIKRLDKVSAVIAVSEALRKRTWLNAKVIGNPYRVEQFRIIPDVAKLKNFIFLGRLVSDKGADLAIKALHKLRHDCYPHDKKLNDLFLTIVGDGPEKKNLEKLVRFLDIQPYVYFTGSLQGESLVKCLNQHRYLLVPSIWDEPFGNVALEGMACGCLPIVSDGGGLSDAVGQAGAVFIKGKLDSLVNCINFLFENPNYEIKLRNASYEHLKAHHPEVVTQKYLNVIEEAMIKKNKRL